MKINDVKENGVVYAFGRTDVLSTCVACLFIIQSRGKYYYHIVKSDATIDTITQLDGINIITSINYNNIWIVMKIYQCYDIVVYYITPEVNTTSPPITFLIWKKDNSIVFNVIAKPCILRDSTKKFFVYKRDEIKSILEEPNCTDIYLKLKQN